MTRFGRALSHLKSTQIDEKIKVLNKELEKTGFLAEQPANSTANFYYSVEPIPGTPAEMTAVPDPEGILTGEWNQPSNGYDASDPNTWENAFNDWSWLRNPNDVAGETDRPVTISIDTDWDDAVAGAGTLLATVGHGPALGYVSNAGVFEPLVTSSYWSSLVPPTDANRGSAASGRHYSSSIPEAKWSQMQSMYASYESMKDSATTKTIQMWYPWSYFWYGSWETYAGTKKGGDSGRYVLINASIYLDPNEYQTKAAVPAYDLITRDSLDDPKYYPGNPNRFMDFLRGALDVGEKALDWLTDRAFQPLDKLGDVFDGAIDAVGGITGAINNLSNDQIQDAANDFKQSEGYEKLATAGQVLADFLSGDLEDGSINNDYLGQKYVNNAFARVKINDQGNVEVGDNVIGSGGKPSYDSSTGLVTLPFNYDFDTNEEQIMKDPDKYDVTKDIRTGAGMILNWMFGGKYGIDSGQVPFAGYAIWIQKLRGIAKGTTGHGITMSLEDIKKLKNDDFITQLKNDGIITEGLSLSEGWESPKHTYIDKDQQQRWFNADDVAPVYPKDPPPEMIRGYHPKLLSKSQHSIPYIKVTKKDLIRSHKLTKDEAQEMIQLVDRLNEFIKNNPDKLVYARERYPKDDVRLAELNFKLDMQLAAADDYIETQFPENKRRLKLIQRAVKKSTQLTDPKTYKKNSKHLPFEDTGILRTVNDLETYGAPTRKKKTRKKNKWIQKPKKKTKQDIMNEKMNKLEIDMKKTLTNA